MSVIDGVKAVSVTEVVAEVVLLVDGVELWVVLPVVVWLVVVWLVVIVVVVGVVVVVSVVEVRDVVRLVVKEMV